MRVGVIVSAVLILLARGSASAQTRPQSTIQAPTFRTGIDLVRVDVTVTGKGHVPLADLAPEDFDIREDGIPQPIQTFQFVQLTGEPSAGDDTSLEIRSDEHAAAEAAREDVRVLVIFLDDYHMPNDEMENVRVRHMLHDFVASEIRPTDLVAVMNPLTPMSDLRLTRSKTLIFDRIQSFQGRGRPVTGFIIPPRSVIEEGQMALSDRDRVRVRAEVSLTALESLVVHLGGLSERRKSVLFVSEGPPLMVDDFSLADRLNDVIAAANTANVTIHTIDARQLDATRSESAVNGALTAATGGRELSQRNDFTRGLHDVMSDASAYYLIGYAPERDPADGRFHKIEVHVRQKGVRVLARKGYWAPTADELHPRQPASPPPAEVVAALDALSLGRRSPDRADWIGIGPVIDARSRLTIACQSQAGASASPIAGVDVDITTAEGKSTLSARLSPERGNVWVGEASVPSGPVTVQATLRDRTNDVIDRWTRLVTVPSGSEIAARLGTPIILRADRNPRAAGVDAQLPFILDRRFRRTDTVLVRLPASPAVGAPIVTAELLNRAGQSLLRLPVSQPAGLPEVNLPLTSLAQSEYVLRFTTVFGEGTATQLVSFVVVP